MWWLLFKLAFQVNGGIMAQADFHRWICGRFREFDILPIFGSSVYSVFNITFVCICYIYLCACLSFLSQKWVSQREPYTSTESTFLICDAGILIFYRSLSSANLSQEKKISSFFEFLLFFSEWEGFLFQIVQSVFLYCVPCVCI